MSSSDMGESDATGSRTYSSVGGATSINIQGLTQATAQVAAFNTVLGSLQQTLNKISQNAGQYSAGLSKIAGAAGGGGTGSTNSGLAAAMFGSDNTRGWVRDLMMFPTRFIRQSVTDNRNLALMASAGLGPQAFASGASTTQMMGALAGQFGNVLGGSPADLVNLMNIAGQAGAGINWRGYTGMSIGGNAQGPSGIGQNNGPRAAGFFSAVQQAQRMNPGAAVADLAGSIAGYAGNIGAQQQSAFLTGGAFSMIGAGNQQKSISQWADGILKWLIDLRPGSDRGRPFSYGELMSQNFPGSNIDAWLTANGVTPDMKSYFWTYALAKSTSTGSSDDLFKDNANNAVDSSVAFQKLKASAAQTRTGFQLAGTLGGAYANKEQSNQFFNELMGRLLNQTLPAAMSTGALSYMQYLPDTMEEIMMQLAERTTLGTAGAGLLGWGSGLSQLFTGDVGDVGDYGSLGGTSTAGLHPDMRRKVDAMMAANPRVRVTSGFRDLGTQQRLKRQGVGRVSGRPSAHTRGMAADLGPASEYGWISRNARKFGLSSGRSQGEPWHVGMGDIGDGLSDLLSAGGAKDAIQSLLDTQVGGTMSNLFGSIFGSFLGKSTPEDQIKAVGSSSSLLLQALLGIFGGTPDASRLQFRDVYTQLVSSANAANMGGLATGVDTSPWSSIFNLGNLLGRNGGSTTPGSTSPPAGGTSLEAFFTQVLQSLGAPVTRNNLDKMAAVAKFEGNVANFNPFNSIGGDFPGKFNSAGVENYPNWQTGVQYTTSLLQQTQGKGNTSALRSNLMSDGSYADWRGVVSAFYHGWGGAPMPNIAQGSADTYLAQPVHGVGDVLDYASLGMLPPTSNAHAPVVFQNSFQIQTTPGGNGGIDVNRTVQVLADKLETEMRRRMARTN